MSNPWNLQLTVVGTNHKHAPIEIRERLWCRPETLPGRLQSLTKGKISEAVVVSTCNRTEIYALSSPDAEVAKGLKETLGKWGEVSQTDIEHYVYVQTGEEAVHHLIRVAAGLDSSR